MDNRNSLDTVAIQNIMSAYCRYVDTKQWESLRDVIADHAPLEFQDVEGKVLYLFHGASDLINACKEGIATLVTAHHLHNPEFSFTSDQHVTVIWAMEDRFYANNDAGRSVKVFHGYGHYHVEFVNDAGRWKIAGLKLTRVRLVDY
ncbi:SnoaL-like domain-containing protein [Chitinophaga sp. YR627]|uniref:nuclear transport factor 2 family protein n=1 Tax=Chitinophaga sp. YR627 TaxID=1881041 RepID=UPI0008E0FE36|nr:nuclear transport factor 2 family protein [Chitinophaga sp. YR627]SFO46301.1 SnoaL-like domain-containing protein [Chitinophaga sp. YR627]